MTDSDLVLQTHTEGAIAAVPWLESDVRLIQLWLEGKSHATQDSYKRYAGWLLGLLQKPLSAIDLTDLYRFSHALEEKGLFDSSRSTVLASIKSLFSFAFDQQYLEKDPASRLKLPKFKDCLSERILSEGDVLLLIRLEPHKRNHTILRTLYGLGVRVSELCQIKWRDLQSSNGDEGQVTIFGKGGKTRVISIPAVLWIDLLAIRGARFNPDNPVFCSRKKAGHLSRQQVYDIVKIAGKRINNDLISPHWLRHCHASHSLDRGAPLSLVQHTLGHAIVTTTSRYLHAKPKESSARYLPL